MSHALQSVLRSLAWHGLLVVPMIAGSTAAATAALPCFAVTTASAAEIVAAEAATEAPPFLPGQDARGALARYMFPDGRIEPRLRCIRETSCVVASRP